MDSLFSLVSAVIFAAALLVTGLVIGIGWRQMQLARKLQDWLPVRGKIITSRLVHEKSWTPLEGNKTGRGMVVTLYSVEASYRYQQNGMDRQGDRVFAIEEKSSDRQRMQLLLKQLAPGADVAVHVSPDNPAESYLMPPTTAFTRHILVAGLLAMLICIATALTFFS